MYLPHLPKSILSFPFSLLNFFLVSFLAHSCMFVFSCFFLVSRTHSLSTHCFPYAHSSVFFLPLPPIHPAPLFSSPFTQTSNERWTSSPLEISNSTRVHPVYADVCITCSTSRVARPSGRNSFFLFLNALSIISIGTVTWLLSRSTNSE